MRQFFERDYYPVSLFYLGMVTCLDDFTMSLPNNTLREIFTDYYNNSMIENKVLGIVLFRQILIIVL